MKLLRWALDLIFYLVVAYGIFCPWNCMQLLFNYSLQGHSCVLWNLFSADLWESCPSVQCKYEQPLSRICTHGISNWSTEGQYLEWGQWRGQSLGWDFPSGMVVSLWFAIPKDSSFEESLELLQACENQQRLPGKSLTVPEVQSSLYHQVVDWNMLLMLQELTKEIGEALCALIDEGADQEGRPKRCAPC